MERDQFYITLPAGASSKKYPHNTLAEFTTELNNPIHIQRQKYGVGLSEIQLDSRICNIRHDETCLRVTRDRNTIPQNKTNYESLNYNSGPGAEDYVEMVMLNEWTLDSLTVMYPVVFPKGYYDSLEQYIDALNDVLMKSTITSDLFFTISNPTTGKLKTEIRLHSRAWELDLNDETLFKIDFFNKLSECITFSSKLTNEKAMRMIVDVKKLIPEEESFLYVYSNIVTHQVVGDSSARLLRIVHLPQGRGRHHSIIYTSPDYLPLEGENISVINIYIRGTDGNKVLFEDGSLTVKLHMRREHD